MASVGEGDCHKDPNFAVVCSFLDKYGSSLGLEPISYCDLQSYLEDTTGDVSRALIDIHVRLLRRIGKSIVNSDRFEKSIIKFCHNFSEFDAWEVESYGYKHAQLATKLRILKNLLECQFDYNLKFKEKINTESAEEMRLLPIGRDKEGQAYWYFLDHDLNLLVYKEEQDDDVADTWKLVCSNRNELANLVSSLQKGSGKEEEDKTSTCGSRSSKEGSPDKDDATEKKVEVAERDVYKQEISAEAKEKQTVKEEREGEEVKGDVKKKDMTIEEIHIVKKENFAHGEEFMKDEKLSQKPVVDILKVRRIFKNPAENTKKEKSVREPLAKKGKTHDEPLLNVQNKKPVQERMETDCENTPSEQTVDCVKEEQIVSCVKEEQVLGCVKEDQTVHSHSGNEELSVVSIENSSTFAVNVEAEGKESKSVTDSDKAVTIIESQTETQASEDAHAATTVTTNEHHISETESDHGGDSNPSNDTKSSGEKSAEFDLIAPEHGSEESKDDAKVTESPESKDACDDSLQVDEVNGSRTVSLLESKSHSPEISPSQMLPENCSGEETLQIKAKSPDVAVEGPSREELPSGAPVNQREDASSQLDMQQAEGVPHAEKREATQAESEVNVEDSSSYPLKEGSCSIEGNNDLEGLIAARSENLGIESAEKITVSCESGTDSSCATAKRSASCDSESGISHVADNIVPDGSLPGDTAPGESLSVGSVPGGSVLDGNVPGDSVLNGNVPADSASDGSVPDVAVTSIENTELKQEESAGEQKDQPSDCEAVTADKKSEQDAAKGDSLASGKEVLLKSPPVQEPAQGEPGAASPESDQSVNSAASGGSDDLVTLESGDTELSKVSVQVTCESASPHNHKVLKIGHDGGESCQDGGKSGQDISESGQDGGESGQDGGKSGQGGSESGQDGGESGQESGKTSQESDKNGQDKGKSCQDSDESCQDKDKCCQDSGTSDQNGEGTISKNSTTVISECLDSGTSPTSPECSSVSGDKQEVSFQTNGENEISSDIQTTHENSGLQTTKNSEESQPLSKSVHLSESPSEIKSQKEIEEEIVKENSTASQPDKNVVKELMETSCEKSVVFENKTDSCIESINEESQNRQENTLGVKNIKIIKGSRRKRKVGRDTKKNSQMVNGHIENSDDPSDKGLEKSVDEIPNKDSVNCGEGHVKGDALDGTKSAIVEQNGKKGKKNKLLSISDQNKLSSVSDHVSTKCADSVQDNISESGVAKKAPKSSENELENEGLTNSASCTVNDVSASNTPSRRKLKRSVPEPASDEPVDSEPNGKRAKQVTRAQKTRAGRNAAARGRSARLATRDSESDDSDTPLSQMRGRGQGLVRGVAGRATRGRTCQKKETQPIQKSGQEEEEEEAVASNIRKKKKPDSSTEALSEEDATPAKKGRNQTHTATTTTATTGNSKSSGNKKAGPGKKPPVPAMPAAAAAAADEDTSGIRRSLRVRQQRARRPPTPSTSSETSVETSEDEDSSEEEQVPDKDFLDSSFTPEEDSGDEEFKPKGRNFQRQAARTSKEETEEVVNDDTPCVKCGKYNHPEMILLCDKCDAGYHTACLRPPLMLIPDGDWFCPPCEHSKLVEKLLECLQSFDLSMKKKDRLNKRQERLAFVGISISNILHGDRKVTPSVKYNSQVSRQTSSNREAGSDVETKVEMGDSEKHEDSASTSSYESKPEPKRMYRSERLALRQAKKRSRKEQRRQNRSRQRRSPEVEVLVQRTCRTRAAVSYQFKEFDELINSAIEDDKPFRREKPPGISRGKDMSNILGASDEEDEKIRQRDGDSGQPPPVVKKKCRRKLTKLDSDEDPDDEDESDEFQLSEEEDSEATECEAEEDVEDEEAETSDSGDWRPRKTWYNSHTSSRRSGRRVRNFVVDDDYNSDENATKRRSTRNSNRGRIHYSDWDSNQEETEEEASVSENSSGGSFYTHKKSQKQRATRNKKGTSSRKHKEGTDSHDSDSSITIRRKNLRRIIKKRRKDESESEDSEIEAKALKEAQKKAKEKSDSDESHFAVDEESHDDSDDSPRFKKKNVLRSSDEDENEQDVEDLKSVADASEPCSQSESTVNTEALPPASIPVETNEKIAEQPKPKTVSKGKKRSDWCEESKVTAPIADVAVPGKVRRMSTSDREPEGVGGAAPLLPVKEVIETGGEKKSQEVGLRNEVKNTQDVGMFHEDKKASVVNADDGNRESSPITEKASSGGKKRTVPNFLDVNSGEESDEQKSDQHKDSAVPATFIADASNVQAAVPSLVSSDGVKARPDHMEGSQQHRSFPHAGQHYPFSGGSYNSSVQGATPYTQHPVTSSPQNLGHVRRDTGPPPQAAGMMNAAAHNGPPGLVPGFPDSMAHQSSTEAGNVVQGVRAPHAYPPRGPRSNVRHPFPPGIRPSSQGMEPGQNTSKLNPEHCMARPVFQGMTVGHYPATTLPGGHMRPGQAQQHNRGMQPPFYMGQQQHARPGMSDSDGATNMGGYIPQNYGARRMPPAHFGQDLNANAVRNPYYGMQSSPPHNMGQGFPRQYPPGMGSGPRNMSSPLTSMGQMARNLGATPDMHSPPIAQPGGEGAKDRRSSLGSPPNQDIVPRQEKMVDIRDIKTESNEEDPSGKKVGKAGKKRAVCSKAKKKASDLNPGGQSIGQAQQQGPVPAASHGQVSAPAEGHERMSGAAPVMGGYRPNSQPYHLSPYQMPYPHGSSMSPLQMTQGSYMNPRHVPPGAAPHPRSKAEGGNAPGKDGEGKWSRNENIDAPCGNIPSKSPVHVSSYHPHFQKTHSGEQTGAPHERRHSSSPGSQTPDMTSGEHIKDASSTEQASLRKPGMEIDLKPNIQMDIKPNIQSLPPAPHTTEGGPEYAAMSGKTGSQDLSTQSSAPGPQDRSMQPMAPGSQDRGVVQSSAIGLQERSLHSSAPGSKDRSMHSNAPGSQDRSMHSNAPGSQDRSLHSNAPGPQDRSMHSNAPGSQDRSMHSNAPGSQDRSMHSGAPGTKDRSMHSSAPGPQDRSMHPSAPGSHDRSMHSGALGSHDRSMHSGAPGSHDRSMHSGAPGSHDRSMHSGAPGSQDHSVHSGAPGSQDRRVHSGAPGSQDRSVHSNAPTTQEYSVHSGTHLHNMPQYSQGGGVKTSEPPRSYYNTASYYSRGQDPRQPMPHNNNWGPDIQGHGLRYGPPVYPYAMNPASTGNRMPSIKSEYGSYSHTNSQLTEPGEKCSSSQDSSLKDDAGKMGKMGESQGAPVLQRSLSSEFQKVRTAESGGPAYQKSVEVDIKPNIRHIGGGVEGADSLPDSQRSQPPPSEPASSLSSHTSVSTSPSVQAKIAPHVPSVTTTTASVCKPAAAAEPVPFHHSTNSSMGQPHQTAPVTSMAPHSSWPRTNTAVPYTQQHMNQWANMTGSPVYYGMNKPYRGPGMMPPHPAYGMDPQSGSMRPGLCQVDQKPFMHQNYESRFQHPYPGLRPPGAEGEYPRAGFNPDYPPSGQYPPQLQNPRKPDPGSLVVNHSPGDIADHAGDLNTVSKPKRAKTQKKPGKETVVGPLRGKSTKGRGRGRGGFMIDSLLQAGAVEADDDGEDSSEMNDIVSYVTTDEYFKQQTSCDSFKQKSDIDITDKKL